MKIEIKNLYKVTNQGWNNPLFVASDNQSEAAQATLYDDEGPADPATCSVQYMGEVLIHKED